MFELSGNGEIVMSSEAKALVEAIIKGEVSDEVAYKYGMQMLHLASSEIRELDSKKCTGLSKAEGRIILDNLEHGRHIAKMTESIFIQYPIISQSAKGLYSALSYSYGTFAPAILMSSSDLPRKDESTSTYFIFNPISKLIKIGRTNDIKRRITALQCGIGIPLDILLLVSGDREKECHQKFSEFRTHGEWFDDKDGRIRAYIKSEKSKASA
ncbi:GIY-YIG nuclease family protein [Vibrio algicola]|uniref:Bacteriophage T5 Orf172 DNA-binding domain-containing protein n=1 Tax=Vibrio algicola TaxID=2662262 RepID=A0A5Q0TJQ1_9VIBR|nr:GIY-YIG nuclease family protein [Vibrio algicola]